MIPGLVQGHVSSASIPALQLFCRWGEHLQDMISGTYQIDDIRDPTVTVPRVASTSFDLVADKLATGRYVIPTGSTSGWSIGTHRVLCTYKMEVGGPDFYHVIEFELLDPGDWAVGDQFLGLCTTRDLYRDEYVVATVISRQVLHRHINMYSRMLESKLGRIFGPRFMSFRMDGRGRQILMLQETIIAVEKVEVTWKNASGVDQFYEFPVASYRVYNRYLDTHQEGDDDRHKPMLEVVGWTDPERTLGTFQWPFGDQNITVTGVWGFTDPTPSPTGDKVPLGVRPPELVQVIGTLVTRMIEDSTQSSPSTWSPSSIAEYKTRDQHVKFRTGVSAGATGVALESITGDAALDRLLLRFAAPISTGYSSKAPLDF